MRKENVIKLGKDLKGNYITIDLDKRPNLIITGMAGTGKTFLLNNIIKQIKNDSKLYIVENLNYIETIEHYLRTVFEVSVELDNRIKGSSSSSPVYLCIDSNKNLASYKGTDLEPIVDKISNYLIEISSVGRMYNVHLIMIQQRITTEYIDREIKINTSNFVSFNQGLASKVNTSNFISFNQGLASEEIAEDIVNLNRQEFLLFSDGKVIKGKTLNF